MLVVSLTFTLPIANVTEVTLVIHTHIVKQVCKRHNFFQFEIFCYKLAFILTEKIQPPSLTTGCASDNDCPDYTACENRKCINPCAERDPCARNAYCKVIRHQPVCTCPDGYIGDPTTSCELRKYPF